MVMNISIKELRFGRGVLYGLRDLARAFLAVAVFAMATGSNPSDDFSKVPTWLELRHGALGYFGIGSSGTAPLCPTLQNYLALLHTPRPSVASPCSIEHGGQQVTALDWKAQHRGRVDAPVIRVQFRSRGISGWTSIVSPQVPQGVTVLISGVPCGKEAELFHATITESSMWLKYCKAKVIRQVVSMKTDTLVVRLGSGTVVDVDALTTSLPNQLLENGLPRYVVGQFVAPS